MTEDNTTDDGGDSIDEQNAMAAVETIDESPESKFADPEDATVPRDDSGEKIPQEVDVDDLGLHKLQPMSYGDVQKYMGDGSHHEVEEEALARIFDEFVLEPDYAGAADKLAEKRGHPKRGRVTAEFVEDMWPLTVRSLLMALFEVSRIDASVMMDGTTANVEVGEGNQRF